MKTKLPWILLAVSLSLNVFFVAGYLYSSKLVQRMATSDTDRTRLVAQRLQLDTHQREEFRRLRALARDRATQLRQTNTEVVEALWDEIVKAQPDGQRIKELLEHLSDNRRAFNLAVMDLVGEFLKILRPEQRETFLQVIRNRNIFR
jgi:Spy/CpxP family protein refolding chaperone